MLCCAGQAGVGAAKTIMMTMIPIDYHTCFIAISPHAKILYANESMANLLGRKVTEVSNKMSLPQLMTVPCQQLHQNFFKVSSLLPGQTLSQHTESAYSHAACLYVSHIRQIGVAARQIIKSRTCIIFNSSCRVSLPVLCFCRQCMAQHAGSCNDCSCI